MPAQSTVTRQDVVDAAQDIIAGGRTVSGGSLRKQIGRGDSGRLMALWVEHQAGGAPAQEAPAAAPAVYLPPILVELEAALRERAAAELSKALASAWSTAERLAGERLSAEIAAAKADTKAARDEADEFNAALKDADVAAAGYEHDLQAAHQATQEAERRAIAAEALAEERVRQLKEQLEAEGLRVQAEEDRLQREYTSTVEQERDKRRHLEDQLAGMRDARLAAETLAKERGRMLSLLAPAPAAEPTEPAAAEPSRRGKRQPKGDEQADAA